jgi:peptidoglycan/LPS O-acetylase OafA/YrhL
LHSDSPHRYDVLDGMRGLAAIWVMIAHASLFGAAPLLKNAYIAVDFFFILSGFVLAYSYGGRRNMGLGSFMMRRLIRLYPMYLAGLALGTLVLIVASHQGVSTLSTNTAIAGSALNLFYVPFLNHGIYFHMPGHGLSGELFAANPPFWSLCFEILANLFFFGLIGLKRRTLSVQIGLCLLAVLACAYFNGLANGHGGIQMEVGWSTDNLIGGFPRVFYGFGFGILLFKLSSTSQFVSLSTKIRHVPAAIIFVLIAMMALLTIPPIPHLGAAYYLFAVGFAAPLLVFLGSALHCQNRILLGAVRFLGWLSYPLYCVHYPIIRAISLLKAEWPFLGASGVIIASLVSTGVAVILALAYDQPIRKKLTAILVQASATPVRLASTLAE